MPRRAISDIIEVCHEDDVLVSTGGFVERVLTQGPDAVNSYIEECKALGFDIIEISSGFIVLPVDDWLRLVEKVQKTGLKAKPEVGIQFGAGGATRAEEGVSCGVGHRPHRRPWPVALGDRAHRREQARAARLPTDHLWARILAGRAVPGGVEHV